MKNSYNKIILLFTIIIQANKVMLKDLWIVFVVAWFDQYIYIILWSDANNVLLDTNK